MLLLSVNSVTHQDVLYKTIISEWFKFFEIKPFFFFLVIVTQTLNMKNVYT